MAKQKVVKLSQWILKLNDQVSAGLGRVTSMTDAARKGFHNAQVELNEFGEQGSKAINVVADQVPALGNALSMLASPLGAVGVGIGVITAGLYKGVQAAQEFDSQFLELRQLNLDKPKAELDRLNDSILDVAFSNGLNATATAKAYFDIQSATGKYGEEVEKIVAKTGLFARVTKANMDDTIQGVAKSMNAFGLSAKDMDAYFASSFKTVQVGITTFDQLAQVQTDYMGAAAAVNQTVDDANKLYAAFSISAKSVNEAATLTKTAFQDITKKSTIDGFKKLGVSIFDTKGQMRGLDAITRDLVPKLGTLNDLQFAKLKEEIGGSEGIRGYLDQAKARGNDLIKMFDSFDTTAFDLNTALKNANGDLKIMSTLVGDKINVLFIKLGQSIMPTVLTAVGNIVSALDTMVTKHGELNQSSQLYRDILWSIGAPVKIVYGLFKEMVRPIGSVLEGVGKIYDMVRGASLGESLFGDSGKWYDIFRNVLDNAVGSIGHVWDAINSGLSLDFAAAKKSLGMAKDSLTADVGRSRDSQKAAAASVSEVAGKALGPEGAAGGSASTDLSTGINEVSGGGKSVRNVTVNISKLIETINLRMADSGANADQLTRMIEDAVVRAIAGAEMTLSNG